MIAVARRVLSSFVPLLSSLTLLPAAYSADPPSPDHAIVAGFERFHSGPIPDPVRGGLLLLGELNCTSCHRTETGADLFLNKKQAPILDAVGARAKLPALRKLLADPQSAKPGTTMPNVLAALDGDAKKDAIEALVQFLATTGSVKDKPLEASKLNAGREKYHQFGCVACHGRRDGKPTPAVSIPLGNLSAKYSVDSLRTFLVDPHKVRPSGRMPSLNLDNNDAVEVANYLLKDLAVNLTPSLRFRCYEGQWVKVPDFDKLTPTRSGESAGFDLGMASRPTQYAMRFEGFFRVDRDQEYTFHLSSDDGSKLWIDGKDIADSDGIHPLQTGVGRVKLAPGAHKIVVGYFDGGGQVELIVEIESANLPRQSIEPYLSLSDGPPAPSTKPGEAEFTPKPELAETGRALFATLGCASCHQLARDGKVIEPGVSSVPLDVARIDAGCLAPTPAAKSPRFALNDSQRKALADAIRFLATKPVAPDAKHVIAHTMTANNCYACHSRDGVGGVEDERKASFETTYADLGDEGTLPPHLNGVGGKLTTEWLEHVLADGAKDRPYMKTRMPKFGAAAVGPLAKLLATVDPVAPASLKPEFGLPDKKVKTIGRHLAGTQAFGCVQCHNFKGIPSAGIPAMDMSLMTRRLQHDWFVRYVVDPQSYRPGTRMPSSWPKDESQLTEILDGSSRKQIEALWLYLADGSNANPPYGIGRSPIPLVAEKDAIIYRAFIEGAGTRGIGVGYPEKANLAFDANEGRLAMIWQGGFMDASKHWSGRGDGFQPPLGDNIIAFPRGPSLATLTDDKQPWPTAAPKENGYRFRGYRLTKNDRPTFLYEAGTVRVEDAPDGIVADGSPAIRRTLSLSASGDESQVWYRAAVGSKIEKKSEGWYAIDGEWTTRVEAGAASVVRESAGRWELIVPVRFSGGKARVTQEYRW
ncbi:MAG: cytochrome c1 [Planctomycetota bacterium]|nr:cytochrome c1 [Planctomycetota bacterium]